MDQYIQEFKLTLRAEGKAPKTVKIYTDAIVWLLGERDANQVTRTDIREHITGILATRSPSYASNQFRALQQFFKFLAAEENVPNLMLGMKPPKVPVNLVPVIPDEEFTKLIATCNRKTFLDLRDKALFMFFHSTGARRTEITRINVPDIDQDSLTAIVLGKASRMRVVRYDAATGLALGKYLRVRSRHKHGSSARLWIGVDGPLNPDAVSLIFRRRGSQAGVHVHPHQFRHTFAHRWLANHGQEHDLMQQAGWTSPQMISRYGASAASERARLHYDRVMT